MKRATRYHGTAGLWALPLLAPALLAPALLAGQALAQQGPGVPQGHPNEKSIGIFIGNELTDDGSTILAGFGHEPSSHWIEIVPRPAFSAKLQAQAEASRRAPQR